VSLRLVCASFSIILFFATVAEVAARQPAHEGRHGSRRHPHAPQSGSAAGPKIWLQDSQRLPVTHVGARTKNTSATADAVGSATQNLAHDNLTQDPIGTSPHPSPAQVNNDAAARSIASGQARPLSLTKGDFDHDGIEDLVIGYLTPTGGAISFHRGNLDAFAPQNQASFEAIGRGEFPAPLKRDFPISDDAERYYKSGSRFLYSHLPFWLASLTDRLLVVLIPLVVLIIPTLRLVPVVYRWRVRSRVYRWYGVLMAIERDVLSAPTAEQKLEILGRLDRVEQAVNRIKMPLPFADQLFVLRSHVKMVRDRVARDTSGH